MSSVARTSSSKATIGLRRFFWEHPEWWVLVLAFGAWGVMIPHAVEHGAHAHHHLMAPPDEVLHWLLMIIAMMLPLQWELVRLVAFRSYRRRRHLAIATFVIGYLAVWVVSGLPMVLLRDFSWSHTHEAAVGAFGLATLWALSAPHARALIACHAVRSLSPTGWAATRDELAYGARIGGACVISCWPLMVACTLTGHTLIAMIGGAAIGALERLSFRPRKWTPAIATFGLVVWHIALAARF